MIAAAAAQRVQHCERDCVDVRESTSGWAHTSTRDDDAAAPRRRSKEQQLPPRALSRVCE